jgi:anionic cell wall polymer biosynthesis LytR-Cps2A-Psr (LCP) family protein
MVDLAGFEGAVDAVGGYEICLERAVRDPKANLDLPAGCTLADGEQTLAWLRSRRTQELTASGWRLVPGVNDLARNERQRAFLLDMMAKLGDFTSPQAMAATARNVAPFVTVDSELGLMDAVDLAWTMRDLGGGDLVQLDLPVYDFVTANGASVLKASEPVGDVVAEYLSVITAGEELVGAAG